MHTSPVTAIRCQCRVASAVRVLALTVITLVNITPTARAAEELSIPPDALNGAVRYSIAGGTKYLLKLMADNQDGMLFDPRRQRRIVDWGTREVRYRQVEREYPIYEYENYETMALIRSSSCAIYQLCD